MHNAITLLLVAKSRQKTGTLHRAPPSNRFAILVFSCGLFVLLLVRDHSHNDTQDVIMHEFPVLVAIPLLGVLFVLYWLWLCFCLLGFFCFWLCFFGFLLGQLAGLRTGPLPVLLWLSTSRQPCMIITIHLFVAIECV